MFAYPTASPDLGESSASRQRVRDEGVPSVEDHKSCQSFHTERPARSSESLSQRVTREAFGAMKRRHKRIVGVTNPILFPSPQVFKCPRVPPQRHISESAKNHGLTIVSFFDYFFRVIASKHNDIVMDDDNTSCIDRGDPSGRLPP